MSHALIALFQNVILFLPLMFEMDETKRIFWNVIKQFLPVTGMVVGIAIIPIFIVVIIIAVTRRRKNRDHEYD